LIDDLLMQLKCGSILDMKFIAMVFRSGIVSL